MIWLHTLIKSMEAGHEQDRMNMKNAKSYLSLRRI